VTRLVKTQKAPTRTTQSAAQTQYGNQTYTPPAPKATKVIKVAGVSSQPSTSSAELPFTGIGLGVTAALGLMLVTLGVFLRRRESRA
jgi:hypothetical protein